MTVQPLRDSSSLDVRSALRKGIAQLRAAHVPSDTLAVELLLIHALGRDRTWLYAHPDAGLTDAEVESFQSLLDRRASGIPTQHLTGKQEFWGLEFEVSTDVLIPRPETEHVVEVALDRLAVRELRAARVQKSDGAGWTIADVGTGSGCIAVALAKELPAATFYALDISPAALQVARRNAARHDVAGRIQFLQSDLFQAVRGSPLAFDLIVSNPPYVGWHERGTLPREVRDHEPEVALYGGEEGYEFYANLASESASCLAPGGLLVIELGHNSLAVVSPLFDTREWTNLGVTNDLAGIPRVLAAEKT